MLYRESLNCYELTFLKINNIINQITYVVVVYYYGTKTFQFINYEYSLEFFYLIEKN